MKHKLIINTILTVAAAAAIVGCSTGTAHQRSTGQYIDDKGTAQRVRGNLGKDSLVKATRIHVESFRGNVHLTGFVDYPIQKQHAEQIARNTEGVEWVKDDIVVKSELPNNPIGQSGQINEPSGARPSGSASYQGSSQQSFQSSGSASSSGWVRGNRGMNSELFPGEFKGEAAGAQRSSTTTSGQGSTSGSSSRDAQFQSSTSTQSSDLAQRVQSELQSDSSLSGQNIQVTQDGDKIVLRGSVATKDQKEALEAKAKAIPGVRSVSNKIDVQK
jgi:osmotically-inducible protein OsmY